MLGNNTFDYTKLIKWTSNGVVVATYSEVLQAFSQMFREVYGSDIDLSTTSADGIYVRNISLMIFNLLQMINNAFNSLDPQSAAGKFLDVLASFSNVIRKQATKGTVAIDVINDTANAVTVNYNDSLVFQDINGIEWTWTCTNPNGTVFPAKVGTTPSRTAITAVCSNIGHIEAPIGTIQTFVGMTTLTFEQTADANPGDNIETDVKLRSRRNNSLAKSGVTILQSLTGALLDINGIDDVKIYNNFNNIAKPAADTNSIEAHSIYVLLRYAAVKPIDVDVATVIYNKLTPGINTSSNVNTTHGVKHTYNVNTGTSISQTITWKECTPINPNIVLTITPLTYFSTYNDEAIKLLANAVMQYANDLVINETLRIANVKVQAQYADPMFRGQPTYSVSTCTIGGNATDYSGIDTYYNYTTVHYVATYTDTTTSSDSIDSTKTLSSIAITIS